MRALASQMVDGKTTAMYSGDSYGTICSWKTKRDLKPQLKQRAKPCSYVGALLCHENQLFVGTTNTVLHLDEVGLSPREPIET